MRKKVISIATKTKTILEYGIDAFVQGKRNYENPTNKIEKLAKERFKTCVDCVFFKKEPVDFLRIQDKYITELSGMYCEDCGCSLTYKTRQSIKKCKKWKR